MEEGKIKVLENILRVEGLIDRAHDKQLITVGDKALYHAQLNDKSHTAINDILS